MKSLYIELPCTIIKHDSLKIFKTTFLTKPKRNWPPNICSTQKIDQQKQDMDQTLNNFLYQDYFAIKYYKKVLSNGKGQHYLIQKFNDK